MAALCEALEQSSKHVKTFGISESTIDQVLNVLSCSSHLCTKQVFFRVANEGDAHEKGGEEEDAEESLLELVTKGQRCATVTGNTPEKCH